MIFHHSVENIKSDKWQPDNSVNVFGILVSQWEEIMKTGNKQTSLLLNIRKLTIFPSYMIEWKKWKWFFHYLTEHFCCLTIHVYRRYFLNISMFGIFSIFIWKKNKAQTYFILTDLISLARKPFGYLRTISSISKSYSEQFPRTF